MALEEDTVSLTSTRAIDLDVTSVAEISEALRLLLADVFALFVKTRVSTGTSVADVFARITSAR